MYNAFIAFISMLILGAVIYGGIWWNGPGMNWRATKWYFGIAFVAALVVGVLTLAGVVEF